MLVYTLMSALLGHVFLIMFFLLFIPQRYSKAKTLAISILYVLFMGGAELIKIVVYPGNNGAYIIATIAQIIATQGTALYISETRDSRVVFTGMYGSNYVMAGGIIGTVVLHLNNSIILALMLSTAINIFILLFMVFKLRKAYLSLYKRQGMRSWWGLCLIPALFYCCLCFMALYPKSLREHPENITGVIFLLITMFGSYVVVFRYVENETSRSDIYWKNVLFESYIHGLESQYEAVEESEHSLKILRHDMRHYTKMIYTLLEQQEYEEAKKVIGQVEQAVNSTKIEKYCENIKVNSIVSNLMEKAKRLGIIVDLDMYVPAELPVDALELASVVANLLENAIHAVMGLEEKERLVKLLVRCVDKWLIIEVENKSAEDTEVNPETGLPVSKRGGGHGVGMQSVAAFVDKLGANFDYYNENGIFVLRLAASF